MDKCNTCAGALCFLLLPCDEDGLTQWFECKSKCRTESLLLDLRNALCNSSYTLQVLIASYHISKVTCIGRSNAKCE